MKVITLPRVYRVYARLESGEIVFCFTWRGLPQLGINQAKARADQLGLKVKTIWAEPVGLA